MNKILKGTIAGAAGITLLLGGASTFALWNSSASTSGGNIVAGDLAVNSSPTVASWSINGGTARSDLTGFVAVPGDVITYTKVMSITAKGDNLKANLTVDPASIKAVSSTAPADVALANYLTSNAVLTATGDGISTGPAPYTVTAGAAGVSQNVTVSVTITFPKSTTPGFENSTKLGSANLQALAVTLTQL
ncbi:alternate-type signal peptide domain-containing protein [Agreia sp. COWG]|uniref:alternate-type signal peptide domain-containing protein n=1 Tax=Agreia sp. COWG TaxID=2773266 RepID=UPI0019265443|nr:alternate-type signal peptide domain-containing protein [Agreia sp. COWG]CAD5994909.1 Alternate-type signal peptide domain-containing protein [Agreia sp. COWG]